VEFRNESRGKRSRGGKMLSRDLFLADAKNSKLDIAPVGEETENVVNDLNKIEPAMLERLKELSVPK
jgi:hypothetical protein